MVKEIKGLTTSEVEASRKKHGDNSLQKEKSRGFFRRFFENLNDPIIKILIIAVSVELILSFGQVNYLEIGGIIAAILIASTVSTLSEYGSEKAFKKISEDGVFSPVKVLRDGELMEILPSELVVGDIVYLSRGEKIQADGILISGELKLDQSALNGESREVRKIAGKDSGAWELSAEEKVFRGTLIVDGYGIMRVCRVGAESYYGMIAKDVQTETRISPLKLRLGKLAKQISRIGYIMALLVGIAYLFNTIVVDNGFVWAKILNTLKDYKGLFSTLLHTLTLMITVIVVAAPEGLPMMVTVVLSANMKKMLRDGVLVKKLVGIETAGSMNILFTDKTGTITTGNIECDKIVCADESFSSVAQLKRAEKLYKILSLSASYNTDSVISGEKLIGGNGTDRAVKGFFKDGAKYHLPLKEKIPFSSENKFSKVVFEDGLTIFMGAPEYIFSRAKYSLSENGETIKFDRIKIEQEFKNYAAKGCRVVSVAYFDKTSDGLVFAALIVMRDKLRVGVREAIRGVQGAGVQIVMLTGDSKDTAAAIARECGILVNEVEGSVITSEDLQKMSDEQVKKILPRLAVLARALPQDKTRLVKLSQELELVVGMTGDGINDAPSLKLADIGFAMDSGADIAKSAGDIVILDNSFFAINRTILYGRTIFKSIKKFICFQLMMNLAACGTSLIGQFLGIDSPITIIQMLWVNIIMDTLGGLAFAGEAPLEYYMKEKPKKRSEPLLSRDVLHHIAFTGVYTLFLCFAFLKFDFIKSLFRQSEGNLCLMTAFYALFIFSGLFNCFGARCERLWIFANIGKNKSFIFIISLIAVIQVFMIYFGGAAFRTTPLLIKELITVILLALTVLPFEMIRRIFYKLS